MPNLLREDEKSTSSSDSSTHQLTVALAGNPNSGKTTIFNLITGARQHVGNYPGVTVEEVRGVCKFGQTRMDVIDLPGTYSLTAYSAEELVARQVLTEGKPDVVVDIVDASNLNRNLYLAIQIMELQLPMVLAFNMSDVAASQGLKFDLDMLQQRLGLKIVPMVGNKGTGKDDLLSAVTETTRQAETATGSLPNYGEEIERELVELQKAVEESALLTDLPPRWIAIKLLEGDSDIREKLAHTELADLADKAAQRLESELGDNPEALLADRRYGFINGVCREAVQSTVESRRRVSDRIDAVVVSRILGLPIFLGLMYLVFQLTFTLGGPPMEWIEAAFGWLAVTIGGLWPTGSESLLRSLLLDGIIGGVGGVLVFLPNILFLFLAIAILEDSGYMARAAFLMDRLMHKIGMHGKSFVPMLIGFGCSVPAIMATRTLESRKDRLVTMLVVPLMSCGARLPIYALIIPAFFPSKWHGPMLWIIYLIGIALAVFCAWFLKKTVLRGETPPFVMELPPYRLPTLRSVLTHMWNRSSAYLKKAGTIILGISILLWAMQQWPGLSATQVGEFETMRTAIATDSSLDESFRDLRLEEIDFAEAEATLQSSLMGRVGSVLEPVLKPCGFDWKISTAMVGAFAAKEVFVSQMGIVYSLGEEQDEESEPLREKLQANYTELQGFCIMLFCLISAPCMATIAVTKRESNSWMWALLQLAGLTFLAWVVTTAVYQAGQLIT